MSFLYTEEFLEHLEHTRNVGEIENPSGIGEARSETCGDVLRMMIRVNGEKIIDIKFKVYGCATAIAGGSLLTEMAKGLNVEDAEKITAAQLEESFKGIPEYKFKCLENVVKALMGAIDDFRMRQNE